MSLSKWFEDVVYTKYRVTENQLEYLYSHIQALYKVLKPILDSRKPTFDINSDTALKVQYQKNVYLYPDKYFNFTYQTVRIEMFSRLRSQFCVRIHGWLPPEEIVTGEFEIQQLKDYEKEFSSGWKYYGQFYISQFCKCVDFYNTLVQQFIYECKNGSVDYLV